jgi:3-oxoacyl-[acyl-carrier-protein] synthase III
MATLSINHVRLAGLAAAVPALEEFAWEELGADAGRFAVAQERRAIPWRRAARADQCQSDLCVEAARPLLCELGWDPSTIDVIVMATLTPDFPIPATAIIVQDRLGVPKTAAAFDLPSGGLGFLHGLQVAASMISNGCLKRALLLTGEVSKTPESSDCAMPHRAVHGHCGSVCALEYRPGIPAMFFDSGGDGSTFEALYMPVGGVRNPPRPEMFNDPEGVRFASDYVLDETAFGQMAIGELPGCVERVLKAAGKTVEDLDGCYFNPISHPVEAAIRKRVGIPYDRFHSLIPEFGGSGSGSIPLALAARGASRLRRGARTSLLAALGPGLAWSSAVVQTEDFVCGDILEV